MRAANALFAGGTGGRPPGLAEHSEREVDYSALPRVTFTSPAIASAGFTEAELVRSGVACDCRVLTGRAVTEVFLGAS
jgi:pyruvate/2-oxoglutarate dehydrogenase complex dihydrolipoamide dehydrogenase (E3) component